MTRFGRLLPGRLVPGRLLGEVVPGAPAMRADASYVLGDPGRPAVTPTLLIAVFDNSGSVTCPGGTDPLSGRFAEVDRAFSVVARKGSRHELGAVLHFDVPSSGEVEPMPITRAGLAQLRKGLQAPADGAGSSRLQPSLHRAMQMAAGFPDHAPTLVILSDFLILDSDPTAVLAELATFPGTVHAVVLGGGDTVSFPTGTVIVTTVQRDDAPGAVAKAVFASLTRYRPGSRAFREHNRNGLATTMPTPRPSQIPQQTKTRMFRRRNDTL